jgi:hypothetical protein
MLLPPFKVLDIVVWPGSRGSFSHTRGVRPVGAILKPEDGMKLNWKLIDRIKLN